MARPANARPDPTSIRPFYADWAGYNRRVAEHLRRLTPDDLALIVPAARGEGIGPWPIWAVAGHTMGARVFWLCHVFGEPGAETTPFDDPSGFGWEDDLAVVRTAADVANAYESTWRIVASCLDRWTPAMLGEQLQRGRSTYTRESTLLRLINHEAYHAGEISSTLAANGRAPIDLWPASDWIADAPLHLREG
jgi:uncharacterized damage-inducible protein DinB